jgi:hypothetical protein
MQPTSVNGFVLVSRAIRRLSSLINWAKIKSQGAVLKLGPGSVVLGRGS